MAAQGEDPAKTLLPFLQRADELQKHEPLVAYYCRLYAMDQGLKVPAAQRTKDTTDLLKSLMLQLEKDKASVARTPEDNLYVEGFAQRVFDKADKQDRAGKADIATAKAFYAAGLFLEVCCQFGPLAPELEQKQKYAVWKAADIRKALKEGRTPTPGPPGGDASLGQQQQQPPPPAASAASFDAQFEAGAFPGSYGGAGASRTDSTTSTESIGLPSAPKLVPQVSARSSAPPYPLSASQNPGFVARLGSQRYEDQGQAPSDFDRPLPSAPSFGGAAYPPQHGDAPSGHGAGSYPPSLSPGYGTAAPAGSVGGTGGYGASPGIPQAYPVAHPVNSTPAAAGGYQQHLPQTDSLAAQAAGMSIGGGTPSAPASSPAPSSFGNGPKPGAGKVAEAHKAARFAVSALAFDDVPTGVEYLKKALAILTSQ